MDLRLATASVGSPEMALISAGVAQLAKQYRLPSYVSGAWGDSKVCDAQSGHEKTLTAVLPALAGANLIFGAGMIESGVTIDYGQLVMDNEFARMIKLVVAGIPVNDETLAVDDIARVGSFGDFLSLDSTLRHMRETSQPRLIDRRVREDWEAAGTAAGAAMGVAAGAAVGGGSDIHARALAEARAIIEGHEPEPLPADIARQIRAIVERADRELARD